MEFYCVTDVLQNTSVFASVLVVFTAKRSENEQKSGKAEGWNGNRGVGS
ncbi:hypothetical protein Hanom_Chr12g01164051 [Helianthus anomalus]